VAVHIPSARDQEFLDRIAGLVGVLANEEAIVI
jgi:hypothetical protein